MDIRDSQVDYADLQQAYDLLESPALVAKLANLVGKPLEFAMQKLPEAARETLNKAVDSALQTAADAALWTMDNKPHQGASTISHKVYAGLAGALGGLGGLTTLVLELPVTTTIMLRSIADIARSEGFDLNDVKTKEACIHVLGFGGESSSDDGAETGYYAARAYMSRTMEHLAIELPAAVAAATKKAGDEAIKNGFSVTTKQASMYLTEAIQAVASRFGIVISEKAALQVAPLLGAVTGASINALFTDHFQDMAHGHFKMLRLSKKYGETEVKAAYTELKKRRGLGSDVRASEVIDVVAS